MNKSQTANTVHTGCRTNNRLLLVQYVSTFYKVIFTETCLEDKDIKYKSLHH